MSISQRPAPDAISITSSLGPPPSYHEIDPATINEDDSDDDDSDDDDEYDDEYALNESEYGEDDNFGAARTITTLPPSYATLTPPPPIDAAPAPGIPALTLTFSPTLDLLTTSSSSTSTAAPLYHLTASLSSAVSSLTLQGISLSNISSTWIDLYDLWTIPLPSSTGLSRTRTACDFRSRRRSCLASSGRITLGRRARGRSAKVLVHDKVVLKAAKGMWFHGHEADEEAVVVAEEVVVDGEKHGKGKDGDGGKGDGDGEGESRIELRVREGVDQKVRDLVVMAACARRWMDTESVLPRHGAKDLRRARLHHGGVFG